MHSKIKNRPVDGNDRGPMGIVKPLVLHEVANVNASAVAASRRRLTAGKSASPAANHARHHVSRQTQS